MIMDRIERHLNVSCIDAADTVVPRNTWAYVHGPCLIVRGDRTAWGLNCSISKLGDHSLEDGIVPLGKASVQLGVDGGVIVGVGHIRNVAHVRSGPRLRDGNGCVCYSGGKCQLIDRRPMSRKVICCKDLRAV